MNRIRIWPALERWIGGALTVLAAVFFGYVSTQLAGSDSSRPAGPLGFVLVAVAILATGAAWRWPLTGATGCAAAIGTYVGRGYPDGPILLAGLVAALLAAWRGDRRRAVAAVALLEVGIVVGWLAVGRDGGIVFFYLGWALGAACLGDTLRSRRSYREEQQARAASLERSRQVQAQQQLAEQRLQIARDLHDGVAHAMATINVQAAAAARVVDHQPRAAKDALAAIAQASGAVLDELNAVVSVLRDHDTPAARTPAPGLDDIADLVAVTSGAKLACKLVVTGEPTGVGDAVGTAAYRIVQESLTNVLRHSGALHATVTLDSTPSAALVVQVADDGRTPTEPSPGTGSGIVGMRERAEATGGTLTARRRDIGFVVRAEWKGRA